MIGFKKATWVLGAFAIISLIAATASAGLLDTGTPYDDGTTIWSGTTGFSGQPSPDVNGTVDWVVFAPGAFPFSGYTPTPGDFTYAYQIHCTGPASLTYFSVAIENAANNIGSFTTGGVTGNAPLDDYIDPPPDGDASWDFDGIVAGGESCGLVFSSPNKPMDFYSIVIDHGEVQIAEPVPSPSPTPIPEPATLWLLGSSLGLVLATRRFRRRNQSDRS